MLKGYRILYFRGSAKTGEGIEEAFSELSRRILISERVSCAVSAARFSVGKVTKKESDKVMNSLDISQMESARGGKKDNAPFSLDNSQKRISFIKVNRKKCAC